MIAVWGCCLIDKVDVDVSSDFLEPIFPFSVFLCLGFMWFFDNFWIVFVWHICSYVSYGFVRVVLARSGSIGKLPFWSEVHFGPIVYLTSVPVVLLWSVRWVVRRRKDD